MNYYSYKTIDSEGTPIHGFLEGEDIDSVYRDLTSKGLYILNVKRVNTTFLNVQRKYASYQVKRRDIIELANNLSVMLKAGVPLFTALGDIMATTENKHLKNAILDIKRHVEMGARFSYAIESHKNLFPDIFVKIIKVGEDTGRLDSSLYDIADHLQKVEDLTQAIKRALMYPIFAIVTTTGALIFWLAYVLPKIMTTIKEMGVQLPLITRILLQVSNFTKAYWYLILILPLIVFIIIQILKRRETTKYYVDMLKIKLPIIKPVVYNKLLALFSEQLRILIVGGVSIDNSFDIVADVIGNAVFKKAIVRSRDIILTGGRISSALKEHPVFPPLLIRMVDIGETSGNLDGQLAFLSAIYRKKLDDVSQKIGKMIEPIVMVIVGGMFALIILGLMLPIYNLVSKFGKSY